MAFLVGVEMSAAVLETPCTPFPGTWPRLSWYIMNGLEPQQPELSLAIRSGQRLLLEKQTGRYKTELSGVAKNVFNADLSSDQQVFFFKLSEQSGCVFKIYILLYLHYISGKVTSRA